MSDGDLTADDIRQIRAHAKEVIAESQKRATPLPPNIEAILGKLAGSDQRKGQRRQVAPGWMDGPHGRRNAGDRRRRYMMSTPQHRAPVTDGDWMS